MTETIIENLKILSESYKHKFDTFSNSVLFVNEINKIRFQLENDTHFRITYNLHFGGKTLLIPKETVYHFCLELFKRQDNDAEVIFSIGKPIDIAECFQIEKEEFLEIITAIQKELDYNYRLKHLFLESKRLKITYFYGLLILKDKQKAYFSNVFDFKNLRRTITLNKTA